MDSRLSIPSGRVVHHGWWHKISEEPSRAIRPRSCVHDHPAVMSTDAPDTLSYRRTRCAHLSLSSPLLTPEGPYEIVVLSGAPPPGRALAQHLKSRLVRQTACAAGRR